MQAGARPEEIAKAEAGVAAAGARLDRLTQGATLEQIASPRQAVAVAQANLERAKVGPTPERLNAAGAVLRQAEAAVRQAQAAYDKVARRNDVASLPQSLQLEQATIEYERARASYQNLLNGATAAEIKVYEQQVAQAQAQLAEVVAGANPADVAAARADVQAAEATLALVRGGARPQEVAAAQAQVEAARAQMAQAQAALDLAVLRAPFAGSISAVKPSLGEFVTPGVPVIKLGDTSGWLLLTDNLTDVDVARLKPGDAVEATIDAFAGTTLRGTVQHTQPASEIKRGDVTYTVTIALGDTTLPLRWGMRAAIRLY